MTKTTKTMTTAKEPNKPRANITLILSLAGILSTAAATASSEENWPRSGTENTSTESVVEGHSVELKCAGRNRDAPAHWDFKPCGGSDSSDPLRLCAFAAENSSAPAEPWRALNCSGSVLSLAGVRRDQRGLYRCRQAATPLINIYFTTRLEVLPPRNVDGLPQFLDGLPKNVTVRRDTQAVFQCMVSSATPVSVVWVWQGSAPGAFRHADEWYAPVGRSTLLPAGGARMAKLVLPRPRDRHAGKYLCVAVNTRGYANSSAYLRVIGDDDDEVQWEQTRHFSFFFFLPVGLAVIPVTIWLYYVWRRRRRLKSLQATATADDVAQNVELSSKCDDYEQCV